MIGFLFGTFILGIFLIGFSLLAMAAIPAILAAIWRALLGGKK
jgi:hypothetical protein